MEKLKRLHVMIPNSLWNRMKEQSVIEDIDNLVIELLDSYLRKDGVRNDDYRNENVRRIDRIGSA